MKSLFDYNRDNTHLTPSKALEHWENGVLPPMAGGNAQQNPHLLQQQGMAQPHAMAQGARTPSGMGPGPPGHQFMSPAMANSLLPNAVMNGSPHLMQQNHTPSPASLPMQAQHSHQGSSATASVNTSPNIPNNKRRRSTAKIEPDDGGVPEMNGAPKVKQSPRVGGNKRLKNN
jgi:hypothetical protein